MEKINAIFLECLKASLMNERYEPDTSLSLEEYDKLFQMSRIHNILPMIYESVSHNIPEEYKNDEVILRAKSETIHSVVVQTMKTNEFLQLYRRLLDRGITPMVVKGIVCRSVYPNPDYRLSSDEDIQIDEELYEKVHEVLTDFGMFTMEEHRDTVYEVPYNRKNSPLYIELHKTLFPPESEAYGELNQYFQDVRKIEITINNVNITTMAYTDNLFYLITHALKHFMHSGFGIRQVCDIVMFANAYGSDIDWERLYKQCEEIKALKFSCAIFSIGEQYLTFDSKKAQYPELWSSVKVDTELFLEDLLEAGVFGDSSMSRKHSSTITLDAISAEKTGRKRKGVMSSLFPPASSLQSRYPYLEKKPYLLPVAWTSRILKYRSETKKVSDDDASSSIEIANKRIQLMQEMGIVEDKKQK